jgi:hypothetical protein
MGVSPVWCAMASAYDADAAFEFVIARSEATKQSILAGGLMDCFASLAMTTMNSWVTFLVSKT